MGGMPAPRMMRKFIERAHECGHAVRDESATALEPWFNEQFPTLDISLVAKSEAAHLFAAYTELNPHAGLRWLRGAIDGAPEDVLQSFGREFDGSGDWRGRRHIVWLCDHFITVAGGALPPSLTAVDSVPAAAAVKQEYYRGS